MPGSDGKVMHASIRIGDSVIMLNDENPEWDSFGAKHFKGSPVTIHLYVENADAVFEQAVRAGAKVTMPLDDMFWGDRYGKVEDPFGHQWSIGTHVRDVTPEEMQKAMAEMGS
jgi:PhnB protein